MSLFWTNEEVEEVELIIRKPKCKNVLYLFQLFGREAPSAIGEVGATGINKELF